MNAISQQYKLRRTKSTARSILLSWEKENEGGIEGMLGGYVRGILTVCEECVRRYSIRV